MLISIRPAVTFANAVYEAYANSQVVLRTARASVENRKYETNAMRTVRARSAGICLSAPLTQAHSMGLLVGHY